MIRKYLIIFFLILCFIQGCDASGSFKFALLSDTHIQENSTAISDLQSVIADVNKNKDIEFTLISGDITEINSGNNLIIAKQILDKLDNPYYIIPGNHDTKWSGSAGANVRSLWGDDRFVFDSHRFRFIGFHQGPVLRMDDGHISLETLTWLTTQLKENGTEKPIILVMHYPLDSSVDNWFECVDIIRDYNIKTILHGHGHRNRLKYYNNIPGIMGRSTLHQRSSSAGYTVLEYTNDSLYVFEKKTNSTEYNKWAEISIKERVQIQTVPDSMLPDSEINQQFPDVKPKWIYNSGYSMTGSPICDDDKVYIGNISGTFYALNKSNGKEEWQYKAEEAIYGTAAIYNDLIVFTSADSNIYCLNKKTGQKVWQVKTNNSLVSVPSIEDGIIYTGSSDGIFRAINLDTGELIWTYDKISGYVESKPLLYDNKVIFAAWDSFLYVLDKKSGKLVWKWQAPLSNSLYSPAACWPVASDGKIFIAAPDRYVSAINAETGNTIWRNNQWKFRETIGISENGKYVYARSMTDSVVAFHSSASNVKIKWANDFKYGYDIAPSMPMEKNGTLYWGTKNGLIIAADSKTGKVKWKYKFQNYLINTVYPVNHQDVIISNIDGNICYLSSAL